MPVRPRLVALISGGGTTLQNLIDRAAAGRLGVELVGVVSSKAGAFGVERAKRAGIPVAIVPRAGQGDKGTGGQGDAANRVQTVPMSFPDEVWATVRGFGPDLVALAGWLHLLPIPADFRHKVLNIHPSLLPAFGGKGMYGHHVHEAVLAYGAKVSGCTVHFADDTYDTGPVVVQRSVPVLNGDTPDALAARVFEAECEAYPEAIELVASGRVRIEGRRVVTATQG